MAKTPRTRHSKTKRDPVTIDLEADSVEGAPGETAETEQPRVEQTESPSPETGGADTDKPDVEAQADADDGAPQEEPGPVEGEAAPESEGPPASEPPPSETPGEEKPRGRTGSIALAVIAGLVGGGVVAGGMQVFERMQDGGAGPDPAVTELRQEMEALSGEVAQLREATPAGTSGDALEQALAGPLQEIADLRQGLAALQDAVSSGGAGENAGLEALDTRIAELENEVATLAEAGAQGAGNGETSERIAALASELEGLRETSTAAQQAAEANAEQLQALSGRLDALTARFEEMDEGPRLALVVAASALRAAVERGEPFARELETFASLSPEAEGLNDLRPYAETGIPTRAELAAEAPQAASRIAEAVSPPAGDAGFLDRLMASARSVITVRPVGEVEGDAPEAVAARMEAAVENGDYGQALAEYESLPPEAQEAARAFAEKLRARQAADRILEETLSSVLQPA